MQKFTDKLKNLAPGDHLCYLYDTEEEHREVLTPFLRQGIEQNQKVVYILDAHTSDEVLDYLRGGDVNIERAVQKGQLWILSAQEFYMKNDVFDPDAMIELLGAETRHAIESGYDALRFTGEMSWALQNFPGSDRLIEYETKLNDFFADNRALALCQYDRRRFQPATLLNILRTHSVAVIGTEVYDNFYYIPPANFQGKAPEHAELTNWIRNLSERKQTEEDLHENERRLSTLMSNVPGMAYRCLNKREWPMAFVSEGCFKLTGYSVEELTGANIVEYGHLIHHEDAEYVWDCVQNAFAQGRPFQIEYRIYTKQGKERWVWECGRWVDNDEEGTAVLEGFIGDVTERKQAEEAQERERRRAETYLEVAGGIIVALDPEGNVTLINRAGRELLGYDEKDIVGKNWLAYCIPADWRETVKEKNEQHVNAELEDVNEFENPVVTASGDQRYCIWKNTLLRDADGEIIGSLSSGMDITERKDLNRRLTERVKEIECLSAISSLVAEPRETIDETLEAAVDLIAPGWQYPEITCARITFGDRVFATANFKETPWRLSTEIRAQCGTGAVDVCYLADQPEADEGPFLEQERHLVDDIARQLGVMIDREHARERYASLVNDIPVGIYRNTGGARGEFLEANPAIAEMFGYASVDEFKKVHVSDLYRDASERKKFVQLVQEKGYANEEEIRLKKRDDTPIWGAVTAKLHYDTDGNVAYMDGMIRDITDRKEAERRQQEQQMFWQSTIDSLTSHIAVLDEAANIIAVNASWKRFADKNGLEWLDYGVGRNYLEVTAKVQGHSPQEAAEAANGIRQLLAAEQESFELEYPCHSPEEQCWFRIRGTRFESVQGVRLVLAHEEITQRKQAELELQKALDELQEAQQQLVEQERQRALTTMASGIAHDFNNALSPIQGFSKMLLDKPQMLEDREKTTRYVRHIYKAATGAAETIRRMRKFYRPREGDAFAEIGLNSVITDAISITEPRWKEEAAAKDKNITIETALGDIANISGNGGELNDVMTNLIFNAVDAMPEGGCITVSTYMQDENVILEFSDNGKGMSEKTKRQCLDPFYTEKGAEGSGLGLATVKGAVQRHNGELSIESTEGEGTTFRIAFPKSTKNGVVISEESAGVKKASTNLQLLVVEDEESQQAYLQDLLEENGHNVTCAANGTAALEYLEKASYHAVITDRAMPEMSGDQVAAYVKQKSHEMPVIMLTGFADMMDAANEEVGAVDHVLSKPIDTEELEGILAKIGDVQ